MTMDIVFTDDVKYQIQGTLPYEVIYNRKWYAVWKVFEVKDSGLYSFVQHTGPYPEGEVIPNVSSYDIGRYAGGDGFHSFVHKQDAIRFAESFDNAGSYIIKRIYVTEISSAGLNNGLLTTISQYMLICNIHDADLQLKKLHF